MMSGDDELFLGTQSELSAWTRPQPGENEKTTEACKERVKRLMCLIADIYEDKLARLSALRNLKGSSGKGKKVDLRKKLTTLKDACRYLWDLIGDLTNGGLGEEDFLRGLGTEPADHPRNTDQGALCHAHVCLEMSGAGKALPRNNIAAVNSMDTKMPPPGYSRGS